MTEPVEDTNDAADAADAALIERVERAEKRRQRARREPVGSLWKQVGQVGSLGWMVALPIVLGAFVGHVLDMRFDTGIRWSLSLMFAGVLAGGYALWRVIGDAEKDGGE